MSALTALAEQVRHHRVALAVGGVLALCAATWMLATAYAQPREERHAETVLLWTELSSYSYGVPVTRNSTHWPIGTTLPMGQPAYFRTVSDHIALSFAWRADVERASEAVIQGVAAGQMEIEVRAQTGDGRPYWSISHQLANGTTTAPGEGLRLDARIDLDALVEEVTRVSRELPVGEGNLEWTVRTSVVYALDAAAGHDEGEATYVFPLKVSDPRFSLPAEDALRWRSEHHEERIVARTSQAGLVGIVAAPGGLLVLATGAALLVAAGYAGAHADAFDRERRRFKDWVSVAERVPDLGSAIVDVGTLEDLVQVAADARTRVLLEAPTRIYYALLPGVTYRYAPRP